MNVSKKCLAEFFGTVTLIFVTIGAVYNGTGPLGVVTTRGLAFAAMVSATGAICGGQLNSGSQAWFIDGF